MKSEITKTTATLLLTMISQLAFGQAGGENAANNYLIYGIIIIAVLIFLYLVIQVSDNLLAIEAKQSGTDRDNANYSIFPSWKELFAPKLPSYTENQSVKILKQGHDIKLQGEAQPVTENLPVRTYGLQPPNFVGISPIPKVEVEVGDTVKAGDTLFFDKKRPDIKYVAPVSGEIVAVNRGAKRSIANVVILADKEIQYRSYNLVDPETSSREELAAFLIDSGLWPMITQRPFDIVPDVDDVPRDIFISTFDTAPLAPDLNLVVEGRDDDFQKGLDVLNKLTTGKVHLGLNANSETAPAAAYTEAFGVEKHWFHGKHPVGNVGVQIHHVAPIKSNEKVWTLGVQEVISIGAMFNKGRFDGRRIVAVTGAEVKKPRYVKTYIGARLSDLVDGELKSENVRLISGDVLSGEKKGSEDFLNFKDDQLTVIEEGDYYELFGWLVPLPIKPSISKTYPGFLFPNVKFKAETNTHGEKRAFVVTGQYEQVFPMDIYLQHLMKSILIKDFERMEGLGIYELTEEDVALAEFVCTSKQPLQQILRNGLDMMREQA